MAWDWLAKGASKALELGAEYKQHSALVERLLALESDAARQEILRLWPSMSERARAGLKVTLAGLALAAQGARLTGDAATRLDRLPRLREVVEGADKTTPPNPATGPASPAPWASAVRVSGAVADLAQRVTPAASELIASARREFEARRPAMDAAGAAALEALSRGIDQLARASSAQPSAPATTPPAEPPPPAAAAAEETPSPQAPHDEQVDAVLSSVEAMESMGFDPDDVIRNMVDGALKQEREAGVLTAGRQQEYSRVLVGLDALSRADSAVRRDRRRALVETLLGLIERRSAAASVPSPATAPAPDDKTALRRAQLEQLKEELEREIASGQMSPTRAMRMRAQIATLERVLQLPTDTDAERTIVRERMREALERQYEAMEDAHGSAAGTRSRARRIMDMATRQQSRLIQERAQDGLSAGETETLDALAVRALQVVRALDEARDEAAVAEVERAIARQLAAEVRVYERRHHLTLLTPAWASPKVVTESSGVFVASEVLARDLAGVAEPRNLKLLCPTASGRDPAQHGWDLLRASNVAVFDLREHQPIETHGDLSRAARVGAECYWLGVAYVLGLPAVIVAQEDQALPFDLDVTPVALTGRADDDRERLGEAIDDALYGVQRVGSGSSLDATWTYFLERWGTTAQAPELAEKVAELRAVAATDPVVSGQLLRNAVGLVKTGAPQIAYPILAGSYPDAAQPRCFMVMPFRDHVAEGAALVEAQCAPPGVVPIRGNLAEDAHVLRSIWDEIGRATHVTVDLTDFNPNVCLELGIADALGRPAFLFGQPGTERHLFAALAKRRCQVYSGQADRDKPVQDALARFLRREPSQTPASRVAPASASGRPPATPAAPHPAPPPVPAPPPAPRMAPATPPARTPSIAGLWTGVLKNEGDTLEANLLIADSGRPVWSYVDSSGSHRVELTRVGQRIQYVPGGGGVVTVVVRDVSGSASESGYVVDYSFERAANGYMDQQYQRIAMAATLRGARLEVVYAETGFSGFGDKTGMTGGENTRRLEGVLERAPSS